MNRVQKGMAKPIGTFLKCFFATVLTQWLIELQDGHNLFTLDWDMCRKLITAGFIANLPVIINHLNPAYRNYGR